MEFRVLWVALSMEMPEQMELISNQTWYRLTFCSRVELKETWPCEQFQYAYRTSALKRNKKAAIVLNATFRMEKQDPAVIKNKMAEFTAKRKESQPAGASLGSIFKNPTGDFAGRLIEEAGLKENVSVVQRSVPNMPISSSTAAKPLRWIYST